MSLVDSSVVTDALHPTADVASTDPGGLLGDAEPHLPEAVPAPTPAPAPTPDPHADSTLDDVEVPTGPQPTKTPVAFFVMMFLIVGVIVAIGAIVRPWESSEEPAPDVIDEPAATSAPATTSVPAGTTATTIAVVAPPTPADPATTTTLVVGTLPPRSDSAAAPDVFGAGTERCAVELRTLEVAVEAHVSATGSDPAGPEALVESGLLQPDQDWSSRWTFGSGAAGIEIVPVAGGECDL